MAARKVIDTGEHVTRRPSPRRAGRRRGTGGAAGNNNSFNGAITPDGRFVAYGSDATNLTAGDTNEQTDLFVTRLSR